MKSFFLYPMAHSHTDLTYTLTHCCDGVVPVSSAQAFPGATVLDMPGSNHEQMKNDSKLRENLQLIYNGGTNLSLPWWLVPIR